MLLADQMNTPFGVPELASPGCPPPYVRFFDETGVPAPQRPPGTTDATCGLRDTPVPLHLNNVAVPGARVLDALDNQAEESAANVLTQLILGGETQVDAALDADPTFATVWTGNNDVLGAALAGTAAATPVSTFQERYTMLLDRLTASDNLEGGVLIGVSNVVFAPFFSPGPAYFGLDQAGQFPPNFEVAANCNTQDSGTGLSPLVPLEYGFTLLGEAIQNPGQTITLDCTAADEPVLTLDEVITLAGTVQQYNAFIEQQADEHGMAYLDPNQVLGLLYRHDDGDPDPTNDLIPKFPDQDADHPFGAFFSLDGVHPSAATHRVVADQLVQVINETYGTNLPRPDNVPELPAGNS